jgi:hypothetical protein
VTELWAVAVLVSDRSFKVNHHELPRNLRQITSSKTLAPGIQNGKTLPRGLRTGMRLLMCQPFEATTALDVARCL